MGGHCGNLKCYCHSESSWIILASYAHLCTDAKLSVDCQRCTLLRPCESQTNAFQPSFIRWAWDRHWQTHKNRTHTHIHTVTYCMFAKSARISPTVWPSLSDNRTMIRIRGSHPPLAIALSPGWGPSAGTSVRRTKRRLWKSTDSMAIYGCCVFLQIKYLKSC